MRAETAYGSTGSEVMSADVVSWLEWCRRVSRSAR